MLHSLRARGARTKGLLVLTAGLLLAGPFALAADAGVRYTAQNNGLHGRTQLDMEIDCDHRGATITLNGFSDLDDVTHSVAVLPTYGREGAMPENLIDSYTASLEFEFDAAITRWKSPVRSSGGIDPGAGGNPWIWISLEEDPDPANDDDWYLMGRCVQGARIPLRWEGNTYHDLIATFDLGAQSCSNKGSTVQVGVFDSIDPIPVTVLFTNQARPDARHQAYADGVYLTLDTSGGSTATFTKGGGWKQSGVGGNPFVLVQAYSGDELDPRYFNREDEIGQFADWLTEEEDGVWTYIGRCSELRKNAR